MPRATIDYLNARRESLRATAGGTNYALRDRVRNPVDERAVIRELDSWEYAMRTCDAIWSDFRQWANESRNAALVGDLADGADEIPF